MFRIWSEWDLGHVNLIFTSEHKAIEWLENHPQMADLMASNEVQDIDDLFAAGLFNIHKLKVM